MKTRAISILLVLLMSAASFVGCSSLENVVQDPAVLPENGGEPTETSAGSICHDDVASIIEINLGNGSRAVDYNKAVRGARIAKGSASMVEEMGTHDLDVVENYDCDSILIGKVVGMEQYFENTSSRYGVTIATIQVEKVFSGPLGLTVGAQVRLLEQVMFLYEDANGEFVLSSLEYDYPLTLNGHYLLFLKSIPQAEQVMDWSGYKTQPANPSIQFEKSLSWLSRYRISPETYDKPSYSLSVKQGELNAESETDPMNYFELFEQVKAKYFTDPFVVSLVDSLRTTPPTPTTMPSLSVSQITAAADWALDAAKVPAKFPRAIRVPVGSSYAYIPMYDFFLFATKAIEQLNADISNTADIAKPSVSYRGSVMDYVDAFNQKTLSKSLYVSTVSRNITYYTAPLTNFAAEFVRYPGYVGSTLYPQTGNFSFTRGCFVYARVLSDYAKNGALPSSVDCTIPNPSYFHENPEYKIPFLDVAYLVGVHYDQSPSTMPSSIDFNGMTINKASYFRLALEAVLNIQAGRTEEQIPYYSCVSPSSGGTTTYNINPIKKYGYLDVAIRQLNYMNANSNRPASIVAGVTDVVAGGTGDFGYDTSVWMFAKILHYYLQNNKLPDTCSF